MAHMRMAELVRLNPDAVQGRRALETPFRCGSCARAFATAEGLGTHTRMVHYEEE